MRLYGLFEREDEGSENEKERIVSVSYFRKELEDDMKRIAVGTCRYDIREIDAGRF